MNIDDLRSAAHRRLPRVVFDSIDGGAERELTLRENCRAFDAVKLPGCASTGELDRSYVELPAEWPLS